MDDGRIAGNRLVGRGERRVRGAEALLEPQMHPRLVAHLDRTDAALGRRDDTADDRVLRIPRKVARVEIDHIVILDSGTARPAGQDVPHRLIKAARDEAPLRQPELAQYRKKARQARIGTNDVLEAAPLIRRGHGRSMPRRAAESSLSGLMLITACKYLNPSARTAFAGRF
jgi:hypothetical protein